VDEIGSKKAGFTTNKISSKRRRMRKKIIREGLPEYFRREPEPVQEIMVTPVVEDHQE
jgi:hypothetical protein